ncbi:MAG: quinone-dependent dihydroorotate dehydrogenase [Elusimicrobiales bacterium]|nr:quinone-dependent dihydroorotate dehydrogenase [Elusimicrobiales bacterium]
MEDFLYKKFIRKLLFMFDPEDVHNFVLEIFRYSNYIPFFEKIFGCRIKKPVNFLGMKFINPIGLAAGFDKNGEVFDLIEKLGFGFCEIGSVSLKPQKGNPTPRFFRIVEENALINHIGLENKGAYYVAKNIEKRKHKVKFPLGINIVKNNDVDFEQAADNICECFKVLKDLGDFFVFNISCPNVEKTNENIEVYVERIIEKIANLTVDKNFFIKISPDLEYEEIYKLIKICNIYKFGIVATNTTLRRNILKSRNFDNVKGGLSGLPLSEISLDVIRKIREIDREIPIISCGGIFNKDDIENRKKLGIEIFEIYTSFIYEGPGIINKLCLNL